MKPICLFFTAIALNVCMLCNGQAPASAPADNKTPVKTQTPQTAAGTQKKFTADDIEITKDLLYGKYTLKDTYKYQNEERSFKWDIIKKKLAYIENIQLEKNIRWAVLQNYKNLNREAPLVHKYRRNAYKRVCDTLGVERYQSTPLYLPSDTLTPERYGPDGTIVKRLADVGSFAQVAPITIEGKWLLPKRYVRDLADSTVFHHAIFITSLHTPRRHRWECSFFRKRRTAWYSSRTVQNKRADMLRMPADSPTAPTYTVCL